MTENDSVQTLNEKKIVSVKSKSIGSPEGDVKPRKKRRSKSARLTKAGKKRKSLARKSAIYTRMRRLKEFLSWAFTKFDIKCWWCFDRIPPDQFFQYRDDLTIHHVDENRENNDSKNLVLVHRSCHQSLHKYKNQDDRNRARQVNKLNYS